MRRLARDRAGNTLAIMAIATIPLLGLAGSAVDSARLYFVKSRLQQACDAGSLAGRKFMNGTDFNAAANQQAQNFFANNFHTGVFGTTSTSFTPIKTADNQIQGTATAVVPMALMSIFGAPPVTLNVACEAKLEIPNLDVMFVLDTTGSMNDTNAGDSKTKIAALRESVTNFYNAVEAAKQTGTQVRYGFVPYATSVNVGLLLKRDWMADRWTYQSRIDDGHDTTDKTTNTKTTTDVVRDWYFISGSNSTSKYQTADESCPVATSTYKAVDTIKVTSVEQKADGTWTYQTRTRVETGDKVSVVRSGGFCNYTTTTYNNYTTARDEVIHPGPGQTTTTVDNYYWTYRPVEFDVSGYKGSATSGLMAGSSTVKYPTGNNHALATASWTTTNACIEERAVDRHTNYKTVTNDDMDREINAIPSTSDATTQWGPELPQVIYARKGVGTYTTDWVTHTTSNFTNMNQVSYYTCPSAARKLGTITSSQLTTYLNGLKVDGKTFHDIGFLWGARLISPTGLFASENAAAPNGSDISRNIIFMTDGDTETDINQYEAYGLSALDRRRTDPANLPTNAEQDTLVSDHTLALCKAARAKNITVWVIAFGTDLTPMLTSCATPGRAYQANNSTELNTTFANIAAQIAKLRLSQ